MTREEAIKIINCYDIGFYDLSGAKIPADKLAGAFDIAIEALKADVVSREEALQAIDKCRERKNKEIEQLRELYSQKPTIPTFAESAEAYKAWTGEEMGGSRLIDKHILMEELQKATEKETSPTIRAGLIKAQRIVLKVPTVSADRPHGEWIPCSERLPDELAAVNITWVNHNPPPYYKYTKDVPLVDSAVYYKGKWYWWDATVIDLLGEYDGAYIHGIEPIDKDIEVVAWMPLPTPYKGGDAK